MVLFSAKTKDDRKIEQHRGYLGVLLLRKKEGFQCVGSGSVVNLKSQHFPSCKEVKCLLTSDVFLDTNSSRIDDYVMHYYLDFDLKSTQELKLSCVKQSTDFWRLTPGLALTPVARPSSFNLKSCKVLDDRRTFPTAYYCNEGGKSETPNMVSLRCFIARSSEKGYFEGKEFKLFAAKDEQGQLRYKLQDLCDGIIFETYDKIRAKRPYLYPLGAGILKFKLKPEGEELEACVGVLNFSNDGKISPVFFSQETLKGES